MLHITLSPWIFGSNPAFSWGNRNHLTVFGKPRLGASQTLHSCDKKQTSRDVGCNLSTLPWELAPLNSVELALRESAMKFHSQTLKVICIQTRMRKWACRGYIQTKKSSVRVSSRSKILSPELDLIILCLYNMVYFAIQYIPQYKSHACIIHMNSLHGNKENQNCTSFTSFQHLGWSQELQFDFPLTLGVFHAIKGIRSCI